MKARYILPICLVVIFVAAPYSSSLFRCRSSLGYLGLEENIGWVYVDKTHYDQFQIAYFPEDLTNRIGANAGRIYFDGAPLARNESSVFIHPNGLVETVPFSLSDYRTTTQFGGTIHGILGPLPHFKKFEISGPRKSVAMRLPIPKE